LRSSVLKTARGANRHWVGSGSGWEGRLRNANPSATNNSITLVTSTVIQAIVCGIGAGVEQGQRHGSALLGSRFGSAEGRI
jgi:hypothetical protein